ncbi:MULTISPECIES: N-acetyltransferase [unclassified Paenibacillus]|uniref:GNAT family N-acetyltransferase n=1 Tax=unclassified Paenibacillus TaxID=185978 RepID=UPI0008B93D4B|nr:MULTISPECIES: N-acetyltransferase [unclassified Paenibacillus]QLG41481.1 GNAT family N-acetyltransferase [Paenibacillus sp. E222]SEN21869.1 Acetyltransferase, GNAT family [Paenibacillus sp. OK076]
MAYRIRRAELSDVNGVARLFNEYRMFYDQLTDLNGARAYIRERMERSESVILIAESEVDAEKAGDCSLTDKPLSAEFGGFVQLYPSFSSVSMRPIWVLNDLYVHADHRQRGIARKLLQAARLLGKESGAVRIALSTAISNKKAQVLYESEGYTLDTKFMYYELQI